MPGGADEAWRHMANGLVLPSAGGIVWCSGCGCGLAVGVGIGSSTLANSAMPMSRTARGANVASRDLDQ